MPSHCSKFLLRQIYAHDGVFFSSSPLFLSLIGVTPRAVRSAFEGGVSRAALVMMRSLSTSMSAQERRVNDLYAPGILQPTMYGCRNETIASHRPPLERALQLFSQAFGNKLAASPIPPFLSTSLTAPAGCPISRVKVMIV